MNRPRSNNFGSYTQESTLDTLSRTIEDLESKILGKSSTNNVTQKASRNEQNNSLSSEIRERQQSLSGATLSQMAGTHMPQSNNGMGANELHGLLQQLRQELKNDVQSTVSQEIANLQSDMKGIRVAAADSNLPGAIGKDLEQIATSLKQFEHSTQSAQSSMPDEHLSSLRLEVDSLRTLVDKLAREDTLVGLDNRWGSIEQTLQGFNPNVMEENISDLASRLGEIRLALSQMKQDGPMLQPLEDKVEHISSAVAELVGRSEGGISRNQIDEFKSQTDARLAQLLHKIDSLTHNDQSELTSRIDAMATRLNKLVSEDVLQNLEHRMANLQTSLENGSDGSHIPQLNDRLVELSNKVDALDGRSSPIETAGIDRLIGQLAQIAQKLDEKSAPVEIHGIDRLEHQLADINKRLDQGDSAGSDDKYDGLQSQIEQLSQLIRNTSVDGFGEKIDELQEHLNSNDEFVLEAARQAAETALQAYGGSAENGVTGQVDNSQITALAAEVKELEKLYRLKDDESKQAFDSIQNTLHRVVDRLEQLDTKAPSAPMPAVAMLDEQTTFSAVAPAPDGQLSSAHDDGELRSEVSDGPSPSLAPEDMAAHEIEDKPELVKADVQNESGSRSLLSGLADRMRKNNPDKHEVSAQEAKEPTEFNALSELENEFVDEPLEPGSGAPDINSIMQKVRNVQNSRAQNNESADLNNGTSPADHISAAHRAAIAASAEVDAIHADEQSAHNKDGNGRKKPLVRKPILIAACALLLAIVAFPMIKQIGSTDQDLNSQAMITQSQSNEMASGDNSATLPIVENAQSEQSEPTELGPRIVELQPNDNGENASGASSSVVVEQTDNDVRIVDHAVDQTASGNQQKADPLVSNMSSSAELMKYASASDLPETLAPIPLKQAAAGGDPVALYEIGARYFDGRGIEANQVEAARWLEFAAEQQFAPAQYRLGNLYEKGTGVSRDLSRATEYYEAAAQNGNVRAMHNLGVLFATANADADITEAATWFKRAAEFGVSDSQVNIAILYARGEGVQRDLVESYKWFAIAAINGDQDAAEKRDQVLNALTADRVKIAKEKVASWQATPVDTMANNVNIPDAWVGETTNTASVDVKKAIRNIQAILNNNGFDAGTPDGIIGDKTVNAIREFQSSIGMKADGQITDKLVQELLKRNG